MTTAPTATAPVGALAFLFEGGETAAGLARGLAGSDAVRPALRGVRRLSRSASRAVGDEVGSIAQTLLDIDLGDALVLGWRRYARLTDAARRTLANPGSREVVELVEHRIRTDYRPSVDLTVDGVRVNTFEFHLSLVFDLTGISAVVCAGDLVGVRGGACVVTAKLTLEGATLAQRTRSLDLALVLPLRTAVALVDKNDAPGVPRQRTDEMVRGSGRSAEGRRESDPVPPPLR